MGEQATPAQRQNLETLIRKGPPNGQFLWPLELATSASAPGFGYLMPLREPLYPHHLDRQRLYNLSQPLAAVQRHPQNPHVWGLNNLSPAKWVMTAPDGAIRNVEPGRSVTLAAGVKVNFGAVEGEIRI
ncbi:MAG: hypothetical protein RKR03_03650 [Candidatus Competibacter sp.]|nr:hypothetical protein [Candidatus Competibacter sp.]